MSTVTTAAPTRPIAVTTGRRSLWKAAGVAVLAGGIAAEIVGLVARAADVPMEAGGFGASHAETIGVGAFAVATVINVLIGTVLAAAFMRWARHPGPTFVRVTVVLTALSLVPVVLAPHTAASTKVTLALAHLVVAAIAIPVMARAVRTR